MADAATHCISAVDWIEMGIKKDAGESRETMRGALVLYACGAVFCALPGLFTDEGPSLVLALFGLGSGMTAAAVGLCGPGRSRTAALTLAATNFGFALLLAFWRLRPHLVGELQNHGIDPVVGVLGLWLLLVFVCGIYETAILLQGIVRKERLALCGFSLAGVFLQAALPMWWILDAVGGV